MANEADDTPRDGHGGEADGGLRYNATACPSAFNLKIGYLPIPTKVVTVTPADQERPAQVLTQCATNQWKR